MSTSATMSQCVANLELRRLSEASKLRRPASIEDAREIDPGEQRRARDELARIASAQQRVADGTYGICLGCRHPIDLERLCRLPATEYCPSCAASLARSTLRRAA